MSEKKRTIRLHNPPSETPEVKEAQAALNRAMREAIARQVWPVNSQFKEDSQ